MNSLALVLLCAVSTAFAGFPFNNFQAMISTCPDHMNGVDLVWAMDSSSSVGLKRYQSGIDFMAAVAALFDGHIGDGDQQTRMGLFEFDEECKPWFQLDVLKSANDISTVIKGLRDKDNNGTHTHFVKAIDYARTSMFDKARAGVQKVLVFVADGWTDESDAEITVASEAALDDKIDIWFIGYEHDYSEVKAKAIVGVGHDDRIQFESVFTDVSKFTGCAPVLPTDIPGEESKIDCHNHGVAVCTCKYPYFGPYCKQSIGCDNVPVVINGVMTHPHLCHGHGNCTDDTVVGGGHCVCEKCWTGKWCQDLVPNCVQSERCIAYETTYTLANKDTTIQNVCDLKTERCVADNIDCMLNVPIKYENNKPVCNPPSPRQQCKCKYPTGWCVPLDAANNIFKTLATKSVFVDKFFTGSSL